jgi:hypothetical protein
VTSSYRGREKKFLSASAENAGGISFFASEEWENGLRKTLKGREIPVVCRHGRLGDEFFAEQI